MSRFGRKFHKITLEDATEIQSYVSTDGFSAEYDTHRFDDPTYNGLVKKITQHYKESCALKFEPVIIIRPSGQFDHGRDPVTYERVFMATDKTGNAVYRYFANYARTNWIDKDDLEGWPGHIQRTFHGKEDIVIPYNPKVWQALRMITKKIRELDEWLSDTLLNEDERLPFLLHVQESGRLALPEPKEED